jgi:hypothetical protein
MELKKDGTFDYVVSSQAVDCMKDQKGRKWAQVVY